MTFLLAPPPLSTGFDGRLRYLLHTFGQSTPLGGYIAWETLSFALTAKRACLHVLSGGFLQLPNHVVHRAHAKLFFTY